MSNSWNLKCYFLRSSLQHHMLFIHALNISYVVVETFQHQCSSHSCKLSIVARRYAIREEIEITWKDHWCLMTREFRNILHKFKYQINFLEYFIWSKNVIEFVTYHSSSSSHELHNLSPFNLFFSFPIFMKWKRKSIFIHF